MVALIRNSMKEVRYRKGDTNMIVCRGLGNSIIPIRFNNRPEIVLLELIAE